MLYLSIAKHKGVTLIEMLFVIIILSTLAIVGITQYNKQAELQKVTRTAQQIQLWSQAAAAYYVRQGHWPSIANANDIPSDFLPYIPVNMENNPWGQLYTFDQLEQKFFVETTVPIDSRQRPLALAENIVNYLPSARAEFNHLQQPQVRTEINVPGQASVTLPGFVTAIDSQQFADVNQVNLAILNTCPPNTRAKLLVDYVDLSSQDHHDANVIANIPVQVNTLVFCAAQPSINLIGLTQ